ncbi:MAG: hypothetical protein IJ250_05285, partial [Bacteroidales bacterium]|nr:hypothetical protein [Bacteroidales bacterium]
QAFFMFLRSFCKSITTKVAGQHYIFTFQLNEKRRILNPNNTLFSLSYPLPEMKYILLLQKI